MEIVKKNGTVQRETMKVGLVLTLPVDFLAGRDFGVSEISYT